ncbi:MAG TPA: polysaccharide biosynthesis tyrosine autokinase, partial [candidate division WOR-3 bacterium]|nr:polysaccharide biosynthesis tyrosine autokinase [candidate division WOR-3 bacterium]
MDDELRFEDILQVISRRRNLIIAVTFIILLLAIVFSLLKSPVYEARARVRLPRSVKSGEAFLEALGPMYDDTPTQLEILKSSNVAMRVINKLGLRFKPSKKFREYFVVDSVKIAENTPPGEYFVTLQSSYIVIKDGRGRPILTTSPGEFKSVNGFGICIRLKKKPEKIKAPGIPFEIIDMHDAIKSLSSKVKISQEGRSLIAVIRAKAGSPEMAKKIADTYAESYVEYTLDDVRYSARVLREFLENQVYKLEEDLKKKEDSLKLVKEKFGAFVALAVENTGESTRELLNILTDFEKMKSQAHIERAEALKKQEIIREQLVKRGVLNESESRAQLTLLTNNPQINELLDRIIELEVKRAELLEKYTPKHPEIQAIDSQLKAARENIRMILTGATTAKKSIDNPFLEKMLLDFVDNEINYLVLDAKVKALDRVLKEYEKKINYLPSQQLLYARLTRKIEAARNIYNLLMEKLEEARIQEASQISDARILDYALLPKYPVSPKKRLNVILGFILGLMVGIFGAFIVEYLDTSVKDPKEVEDITQKPVLSIIPIIKLDRKNVPSDELVKETLITHFDPMSPIAEAFKKVNVNLNFIDLENKIKVIAFTSSVAGEGKSTLACNCAIAYAHAGNKVLLVDADFRKPSIHKFFNIEKEPGFSDVLLGKEISPKETDVENLFVLPAGSKIIPTPTIFTSKFVETAKKKALEDFDYIVVDTPPVIPVSETLSLLSNIDGVLLVVKAGVTDRNALLSATREIERANINLLGVIFNAFDFRKYS